MASDLETWYAALMDPIKFVHIMTLGDLDLFYGKVKFGHSGFCMVKR